MFFAIRGRSGVFLDKKTRGAVIYKAQEGIIPCLDCVKEGKELYALGTHLLVELKDCNHEILKDLGKVKEAMVSAAKYAKATIIDVSFHEFSPFGISGMVVIAESHLSIHTWPEYGYAAVDIFTCGDVIKPEDAAQFIIEQFQCKQPSIVEMKRGILSLTEKLPFKACDSGAESKLQLVS